MTDAEKNHSTTVDCDAPVDTSGGYILVDDGISPIAQRRNMIDKNEALIQAGTSTRTRYTSWPRTPASDLSDRLQDPEFATQYGNIKREADRMVNRLFSGRFTWFWRLWYGVRGL